MATSRLIACMLLLAALAPAPALASNSGRHDPQTAPCYAAAMAAATRVGAIYSQGGALDGDPIDPASGSYYPRTGPDSFDCSGLVWWAYAQAGITIGSTTYQQIDDGVQISCTLADLHGGATTCWALGDLAFLSYTGGQHVAIYVGSGLFMDCYNHDAGCILHDISSDAFYQAHFAQARRIVSGCEGLTYNPGAPSTPGGAVQAETIPDLLGYVAFTVPQCGTCGAGDGDVIPLQPQEPPEFDWNPLYPFRWLLVAVQNLVVTVLCWLLTIVQMLANIIARAVNVFIRLINTLARVFILIWLAMRAWLLSVWLALDDLRGLWGAVQYAAAVALAWLAALYQLIVAAVNLAGQLTLLLLQLAPMLLNLIGYVGGVGLTFIGQIIVALRGETSPPQLVVNNHIVYRMVRGALDALHDSSLGWLFWLSYALAYIGFVIWLSRFLSNQREES